MMSSSSCDVTPFYIIEIDDSLGMNRVNPQMQDTHLIANLSASELRDAVGQRYGQVATQPDAQVSFPTGRDFAEAIGYPKTILDSLPATASASFAGVAYIWPWLELEPGMIVADLGCGAGLDTLIAAQQVGAQGRIIGIDFSEDMVALAERNAATVDANNIEIIQSPVESVPLPDNSLDAAITNGIFNLSPEKKRVIDEIMRLLRPGATLTAAEIVLTEEIPASDRSTLDDWFR